MLMRSKPIFTPQQKREIHAGAVGFNACIRAAERRFGREANALKLKKPQKAKQRNQQPNAVDDRSLNQAG